MLMRSTGRIRSLRIRRQHPYERRHVVWYSYIAIRIVRLVSLCLVRAFLSKGVLGVFILEMKLDFFLRIPLMYRGNLIWKIVYMMLMIWIGR